MLAALLTTGAAGCVTTDNSGAVCEAVRPYAGQLRSALLDAPDVPDTVGEPAADLLIGLRAGCRWGG